jgi:3-ketosteroid 9alpha-monooxygenase subunit B
MVSIDTTVIEIRPETPDGVTLRLDLGATPFPYRPGQYIEIDPHQFEEIAPTLDQLEAEKGMPESPRAFSLCSDTSDPRILEISVKEEKGGRYLPLLTPFLVRRLAPGRRISISGPSGRYCMPELAPSTSAFLHICAGSGVSPNRGMITYALGRGWPQKHLLVLQNRTEKDVFFRNEWPEIAARHGGLFRIRHVFSVTDGEHLSPEIVRSAMEGFIEGKNATALVCGPNRPREVVLPDGTIAKEPGFCEKWSGNPRKKLPGLLAPLGFTPDHILTEMW